MSACCTHSTAQAKRCSSPPLRSSTFLSRTGSRSMEMSLSQWEDYGTVLTKCTADAILFLQLILPVQHGLNRTLHSPWDLVHVLWLNGCLHSSRGNTAEVSHSTAYFQVIFKDFGKVVLQFRASKVSQNITPVWRALKYTIPHNNNVTLCTNHMLTSYWPRFGFIFPARILSAVDLPMPLVPTRPSTSPGRGIGRRWSLKELAE